MNENDTKPKFSTGRIVATPDALETIAANGESPATFLARHVQGDWGDLCEEDRRLNDQALVDGSRIFSAYLTAKGERIWVITEADRSSTCLLRPENY